MSRVGVDVPAATPARTGRPHRLLRGQWYQSWLAVLSLLALLELLSRTEIIPSQSFPPVTTILRTLAHELTVGGLWHDVGFTLASWALGLCIAAAGAIPLGVALGTSSLAYRASRPIVEFMRPIPSVALIPLTILVFGTGVRSAVFLSVFASLWPLLIQTVYGVRDVDPVLTDTARSFGFGTMSRLVRITLPSAVPYIATGLRIASSVSLILVVTAELVIGSPGLGQAINIAQSGGSYDVMYALIVLTGIMGWVLNAVFVRAERRVLHWHPSQRVEDRT